MSTVNTNDEPDLSLAAQLLALPTLPRQLAWLQEANQVHPDSLLTLLDDAATRIRTNPTQARQLAILCAEAAAAAGAADLIPRANYLQAQTHALAGELDQALTLINAARAGYTALGDTLSALRTTAGLMHVLGESGRYQEALDAGQAVISQMEPSDHPPVIGLLAHIQQNMGLCYNALGRYEEALNAYQAAESYYLILDMPIQAGDISNNRGILLWEMGRGSEALTALETALAIRTEAEQTMLQAQTLSNMGSVYLLLGRYTASLDSFAKARHLFASLDALVDQHVLLLDTANAYLTLNLHGEAMMAYQEAAHLLKMTGVVHQRMRASWGLGATLLALGQPEEAEAVLAKAAATLEATSDTPTPLLATILLELAAAHAARQKVSQALTTAQYSLDLAIRHGWTIPTLYAHLQLADLTGVDRSLDSAVALARIEKHLLAAHQLAAPFSLPQLRYRLQQRLGHLRRQQGLLEEARQLLEEAIAGVEQLRGTLAQETLRTSFLHDKVAAYDELIQLYLSWDNEEGYRRAFAIAEQSRSRTLLDLITGVVETGTDDADQASQQLQADLNIVYNELLNTGGMVDGENRFAPLQARAADLERAIQQNQLRQSRPEPMTEQWAAPTSLQVLQASLQANVTLLAYHIISDEIIIFVVTQDALYVCRSSGSAGEVQGLLRRLAGMLDRMRAGGLFSDNQIGWLELSARRVLTMLYEALVAPAFSFLDQTANQPETPHTITVVPHSFLHQVPFQALFDGQGYLIDRYEITYAPSATIYHLCQARPQTTYTNALIVGVPDPSIPAVTGEIEAIAAHLPQARVLLAEQATQANFQDAAANCHLLHLACHGLFRADNPMFSALKLHDGWLTAHQAISLNLPNALVTLSACESGRSQSAGGHELLGLLRAFLGAGAATIVVSLWLAQDDTTARLMADWYERLQQPGATPAQALRMAQLACKAAHPHPYHWASFIAVGRR